ncbi:Cupredoxin [Bombardia bombarda]|uniref:Cupredoxin n=1 Tax=Bombardia bombarda TaxID=252184 RepID=A0AA39X0I9_9PEZI|nr:Cupredoxin [Bombardia bombarda]
MSFGPSTTFYEGASFLTATGPRASKACSDSLRTFNWDITWARGGPDGYGRPFVGINGRWPCPPLIVSIGDTVRINVVNRLGNESTAIHFHGIFQNNTNYADGAAMVTQCPIPPGASFTYEFKISQSGTYWYHAHIGGQYIDGLRGPLIVGDPKAPYARPNQEIILALTDLYHNEAPSLIHTYLSAKNTQSTGGAEPVPDSSLINEGQFLKINIQPGQTYLFRVLNMGAMAAQYLEFDGHDMTIVEVDGVYTKPMNVRQLFVGVAQRYSVLVKAKTATDQNFAFVATMNTEMFDLAITPPGQRPLSTNGWLVYNWNKPLPKPFDLASRIKPWDDTKLVPYDQMPILKNPTINIELAADFAANSWGSTRATFNGITYLPPKVPTLYTALSAPSPLLSNPTIYGTTTNPSILPFNAIVELTILNHDTRAHPFHLHGHNFQVISRGEGDPAVNFPGLYKDPAVPMRRDTLIVYGGSAATVRFVADNPGVQLFHCHTEWHVEAGMTATFVEAPEELRRRGLRVPAGHEAVCKGLGVKTRGNAVGNERDWEDLRGRW